MNVDNTSVKLQEEKIRIWVRNILRETRSREELSILVEEGRLLKEDEALYNTFVAPFTDVLKATALAGQDILNAIRLNVEMLVTLDPDKMDKVLSEYDKRHEAIAAKWKPLMDATDAALTAGDAGLVAFVLAPQMYLGAKLGRAAYDKTGDIYQYLDEAGMTIPLMGMLPNFKPPRQTDASGGGGTTGGGESSGLLGTAKGVLKGLADMFFIAHHAPSGPLLSEAILIEAEEEEQPKKKGTGNFEEDLAKFFEDTGLDEEFEKSTKEMIDAKKDYIDQVMEVATLQLEAITLLGQADSIEKFNESLKKFEEVGVDVQASGADKVEAEVEKAAKELASSEEFLKTTAEENGSKAKEGETPEVSEQEAMEAARKVAFNNAKQNLQKQLVDGIDKLKKSTLEALTKDSPTKEELSIIKNSDAGKDYTKMLEEAKSEVESYTLSL
mgnify:CR=1 FL=1